MYNVSNIEPLEYELFLRDIIAFIFFIVVGIIGFFGNLHVIFVYVLRMKPSNHRTMIVFLAALDFSENAINIPLNLYNLRHQYNQVNCTALIFVAYFLTCASGLTMLFIAVERYRKVCCPLRRQFTIRNVTVACSGLMVVSFLVTMPSFFLYGSGTYFSESFNHTITTCTMLTNDKKNISVKAHTAVLLIIAVVSVTTCTVCYSAIVCFVQRHRQKTYVMTSKEKGTLSQSNARKDVTFTLTKQHGTEESTESKIDSEDTTEITKQDSMEKDTKSFIHAKEKKRQNIEQAEKTAKVQRNADKASPYKKKSGKYGRTVRLSFMFLVATLLTYLCYIIAVVFICVQIDDKTHTAVKEVLGPGYWIFRKFAYVGTVINPFVYGFFDRVFRKTCFEFYISVFKFFRCFRNN